MLDGGGEFGVVVFGAVLGAVVFGLAFGLVPFGFVWLGVSLGVCPFIFPLGLVVPGVVVFGFVVPGFVVPGVAPVGGLTEPVGGGGGVVAPGVRDWPLCPAAPVAEPAGAEPAEPAPAGAACATIQVAQSKTTESNVTFFIDIMEASGIIRGEADCPNPDSVGSERREKYPADALERLLRKRRGERNARQDLV